MKILVAADMEGISGVVHWDQVTPGHFEYERFRRLMTADVNAAIQGAFSAGAEDVTVTDGHMWGRNILVEEMDRRARLNSGTPAPLSMVQGVEQGVDGVMFLGYHARIGSENAILDHTWSDERVAGCWINGQEYGETGLNGAVCGHFGVPVIMVSGDQTVCGEALDLLGPVETAVVKVAHGRMSAECLPPELAQQKICEAAARAVMRLRQGAAPAPLRPSTPINLAVDFVQSEMADRAAMLPGARRGPGRRIEYTAGDMLTIYQAFRAAQTLARA